MSEVKTIGIIGLGLIGGSILKALRARVAGIRIIAADPREDVLQKALDAGLADETVLTAGLKAPGTPFQRFRDCGIVFVCTPVGSIVSTLQQVSVCCSGILTDTGSTKARIIKEIEAIPDDYRPRFIGGHPMAGSERSGFDASSATLLENAIYVLSPARGTREEDYSTLETLISKMGALPLRLGGEEHDRSAGMISHLPHVAAACLTNAAHAHDRSGILRSLAAGGFRDITRIASSNAAMWTEISLEAGPVLEGILKDYILRLQDFKAALARRDEAWIREFFEEARKYRDTIPVSAKGILPAVPEVWVDVEDKPGVLAHVTTLLGDHGINIRNIHIQNSREYEGGCLRLSVHSREDGTQAVLVLTEAGYTCRQVNE